MKAFVNLIARGNKVVVEVADRKIARTLSAHCSFRRFHFHRLLASQSMLSLFRGCLQGCYS
ncbi:hypothetical protein GE21DRAFT_1284252, partial [Neurospora crassa]